MTDLEMTKLCAEAMGLRLLPSYKPGDVRYRAANDYDGLMYSREENRYFTDRGIYDPFTDDAQAMALVKRFHLDVTWAENGQWHAVWFADDYEGEWAEKQSKARNADINRAIVECVAKMHSQSAESR